MGIPVPRLTVYTGDACVWQIPLPRLLTDQEAADLHSLRLLFAGIARYENCLITLDASGVRPTGDALQCLSETVRRLHPVLWDMGLCTGEDPGVIFTSFSPVAVDAA
jgi:hypothetical protein